MTAKRQFIEDNYDYSTNVKDLSIELFRTIQSSNTQVNTSVNDFLTNLTKHKEIITKVQAEKLSMK